MIPSIGRPLFWWEIGYETIYQPIFNYCFDAFIGT